MKRKISLLLIALFAASSVTTNGFSVYFGEIKAGLQFVQENEKTSYFLFLPDGYDQTRRWPLVVGFPKFGSSGKKYVESWIPEAKKRGLIVVAPNWYKSRETPEPGDKWVLKIIADVIEKYNVDQKRVLVTGFDDGADYACYLAVRYPREFSAAAPIGGAITPIYKKIVFYGRVKRNPLPFYFVACKDDPALAERELTYDGILKVAEKLKECKASVEIKEAMKWKGVFDKSLVPGILDWFDRQAGAGGAKKESAKEKE